MISRKRVLGLSLMALLAIPPCSFAGVTPLTAERPGDEAFHPVLKKETSMLNIAVEASTDEIAGVLNQALSKELYKGSAGTSGLTVDVVRNGPLVVSAADSYLYVTLPVAMSLSYGMFETQAMPLELKFKAQAGVTPDWKIHAQIQYLGLSDLLAGEAGIGPLSLKPRSILDEIIQPLQRELSDLISRKVNDLFPLKTQVAKVWNRAQKPVLLDASCNAWLKLTPREVMLSPLYAGNNRVKLSIGISTFAELVLGREPVSLTPLPLPDLKPVNSFDKTFRITLNADLFYSDLRAVAATLLLNRRFDSDGNSLVIRDLDLYGSGDKLVVKLQTEGSLEGVFYLTARPAFNPQTGIFSLEDVDFDMPSQNLLQRSGAWFLHGSIRSMLQEELNMNLTRQLEQARQMAGKALARVQLAEHVFLKGDLKSLRFNDMIVQKDKISIQVYTEGESAVYFQ